MPNDTMSTETPVDLATVLVDLFDQFQRHENDETEIANDDLLQTTVANALQAIQAHELSEGVSALSLATNRQQPSRSTVEEVSQALEQVWNCTLAYANNSSSSSFRSNGPSMRLLEVLAAVTVKLVAVRSDEDQNNSANKYDLVLEYLLKQAVDASGVLLERVRSTACRFLGFLVPHIMNLTTHHSWKNDMLDDICQTLIPRFTDKSQSVRHAAIDACRHFFDKDATDADLQQALVFAALHDPSISNRVAALNVLPVNSVETTQVMVSRVRDVKEKVRVAALEVLQRQSLKSLDSDQCATLVESGLNHRCELTREATHRLLRSWIQESRYDPITLAQSMNVLVYESQGEEMMKALLDLAYGSNEQKPEQGAESSVEGFSPPEQRSLRDNLRKVTLGLLQDSPSPEMFFVARMTCKYAVDSKTMPVADKDAFLSFVDIFSICEMLEKQMTSLMNAVVEDKFEDQDRFLFVCQQLIQLATVLCCEEEGSRRQVESVLRNLLQSILTPEDMVETCVQSLHTLYSSVSGTAFLDAIVQVVTTLQQTEDPDMVEDKDEEKQGNDLEENRLLRILSILSVVLEKVKPSAGCRSLIDTAQPLLEKTVAHSSALVREASVSCIGKMGILQVATNELLFVRDVAPSLLDIASNDDEEMEIRCQAMLSLSDWTACHAKILDIRMTGKAGKAVNLVDVVTEFLVSTEVDASVNCIAAEVAAKLLASNRVFQSTWLAQLVRMFFQTSLLGEDEEEEEEEDVQQMGSPVRLQQLLSIFFPAYCLRSVGRDALVGAIGDLLTFTYQDGNAKSKRKQAKKKGTRSPQPPISKMISYICETAQTGKEQEEQANKKDSGDSDGGDKSHQEIAAVSSYELRAALELSVFLNQNSHNLTTVTNRNLTKSLAGLEFVVEEEPNDSLSKLKQGLEELGMALTDTSSLRHIATMLELLSDVAIHDVSTEEEEEEDTEKEDEDDDAEVPPSSPRQSSTGISSEGLTEALGQVRISESSTILSVEKARPLRSIPRSSIEHTNNESVPADSDGFEDSPKSKENRRSSAGSDATFTSRRSARNSSATEKPRRSRRGRSAAAPDLET